MMKMLQNYLDDLYLKRVQDGTQKLTYSDVFNLNMRKFEKLMKSNIDFKFHPINDKEGKPIPFLHALEKAIFHNNESFSMKMIGKNFKVINVGLRTKLLLDKISWDELLNPNEENVEILENNIIRYFFDKHGFMLRGDTGSVNSHYLQYKNYFCPDVFLWGISESQCFREKLVPKLSKNPDPIEVKKVLEYIQKETIIYQKNRILKDVDNKYSSQVHSNKPAKKLL